MPSSTRVMHPSGKLHIHFTEADHSYVDDCDIEYISATTLIHSAFPAFDGPAAAAAKSSRTGIPAEQYLREWEKARDDASESGTRAHENCERQILGRFSEMHRPKDEEERRRFRAAWHAVEDLKRSYSSIEPEKLVFSPRFRVAGSIDLFSRIDDMHFDLGDWKYVKELRKESYGGRTGIHPATVLIPDANFWHYALQLNLYEMILKTEGYIPMGAEVRKFLKRYNRDTGAFDHVVLPDLRQEALMLMAWNVTNDGLENIPF